MYDVKNLNIWKPEEKKKNEDLYLNADITELNLGVRSFNCLKRAGCNTIRDVIDYLGEDGQGLRRIRNLGARSEAEIIERIEEFRELCDAPTTNNKKDTTIIKPAKKIWDRRVDEFCLSEFALKRLKACGIEKIGDLYKTNTSAEPGWYAVRELFEKIPSSR